MESWGAPRPSQWHPKPRSFLYVIGMLVAFSLCADVCSDDTKQCGAHRWRLRVGQHSDTRLRQCSLQLYWAKKPVSLKNTPVGAVNIINSIKFQSFNRCLFKYSL